MSKPLIIIDYNDTLITELEPSPYLISQIQINPEDLKAIAHVQQKDWFLAIITNQAAIEEKQKYTLDQFNKLIFETFDEMAKYGVVAEKIPVYTCPHRRESWGTCRFGCRKPGVASVIKLFNEYGPFDLNRIAFIGDKPDTDLEIAYRCGFLAIQVRQKEIVLPDPRAALVANSVAEAITWLENKW